MPVQVLTLALFLFLFFVLVYQKPYFNAWRCGACVERTAMFLPPGADAFAVIQSPQKLKLGESVQAGSARSDAVSEAFFKSGWSFLFFFLNCYSEDARTQQSPLWQMSPPALKATDGATPSQPLPQTPLQSPPLPPPKESSALHLQTPVGSAAPPSTPAVALIVSSVGGVGGGWGHASMLVAFHCLALSTSVFFVCFVPHWLCLRTP